MKLLLTIFSIWFLSCAFFHGFLPIAVYVLMHLGTTGVFTYMMLSTEAKYTQKKNTD